MQFLIRKIPAIALATSALAAFSSTAALAQPAERVGTAASNQSQTNVGNANVVPVFQSATQLTLSPGLISFQEPGGGTGTRFTTSALVDWNFSPTSPLETPVQYGLESGLVYSHVGAPGGNFFGANAGNSGIDGNLFIVPAHLWAGYYFPEARILASLQTGADLYMRTDVASMRLGREADRSGGAIDFFPNFGLRVGWDLQRNVALTLRTEWTLAPNATVFMGMLGATIPLS